MDVGWLVVGAVVVLVAMKAIINLAYAIDGEPDGKGDGTVLHSDELSEQDELHYYRWTEQDELNYRLSDDARQAAEDYWRAINDDYDQVYHHYDDHYGTSPFDW